MRLRALFHRHKWVPDPLPDEFIRDGLAAGMPVGAPRVCTTCRVSSCCGRRHEPRIQQGSPAAHVKRAATGLADPRPGSRE